MKDQPTRVRSIEQLRFVVSMLCNFIWTKNLRPGEHLWSIPADLDRDFDIILSDAIDELEQRRADPVDVASPQSSASQTEQFVSPEGSAIARLQAWRDWAQFVFGGGGPAEGTDEQLRAMVCAAYEMAPPSSSPASPKELSRASEPHTASERTGSTRSPQPEGSE